MTTETGAKLAAAVRAALAELKTACAGVDEAAAGRAPEGRWTPREILSHILGQDEAGMVPMLERFLAEDTPRIDLVPEQTWMSDERRALPFAILLDKAAQKYEAVARFAEGLSAEQLARTARIPLLKASPMGEYPTLGTAIGGFGAYHVRMHAEHLREVLAGQAEPQKNAPPGGQ
jgi:hypothetical protein